MVACCHLVALDKAQGPVGITLANSETQLADSKRKVGVVVHAVEPLGSAAAAGLMVGDVIMAVNGKTVSNHWEAIAAVDHDSHVEFKVWGLRPSRTKQLLKVVGGKIGITLSSHDRGPGVLVSALEYGGQAHRLGIREGDVILAVNGVVVFHHSSAVSFIDEAADVVNLTFVPATDDEPNALPAPMDA